MKDKSITFVLDENLKSLNKEVDELLFNLKNPLAGDRVHLIKKFTREMIKAYAEERDYKISKQPPKEALIISTQQKQPQKQELELPTDETLDFEIPAYPLEPEIDYTKETLNIQPRFSTPKKPVEKPKPVKKPEMKLEFEEEHINLVKTKSTGEEMAYAIQKGLFYIIHEIPINEEDKQMLNSLKPILEKKQQYFQDEKKFHKIVKKIAKKNKIGLESLNTTKIRYYLIKHIINFGLIDPLFHDPKITKIVCDSPQTKIQIIRDSKELITNIEFKNQEMLSNFIKSLAKRASKKLSEDDPSLEVTFENFRIHATLGTEDLPSRFVMEKVI